MASLMISGDRRPSRRGQSNNASSDSDTPIVNRQFAVCFGSLRRMILPPGGAVLYLTGKGGIGWPW
jgi:hypothetical protein